MKELDQYIGPSFALNSGFGGSTRENIVYVHDPTVGYYHYGQGHPMKPYRLALTHDLIVTYGLTKYMQCYCGRRATKADLLKFHASDYVDFLHKLTNEKWRLELEAIGMRFNIGDDCPVFAGMYDFCCQYTGSSLDATKHIINGTADIAINWSGGLHHAKQSEASGFCYINDITLSIIELLKHYPRILYIDIDVHHGDGVQEAFYTSDRVLTLSFHKYGDGFFPGSGKLEEIGVRNGKNFTINVPLHNGIDDAGYAYLFQPIVTATMETYRPSVIVLQCGADSLGCDRLGCFNLSLQGHGNCISFIKSFKVPLLVLGGGGYTIRNVSRCWAYETGLLCSRLLPNELPSDTQHREYFAPDYQLFPDTWTQIENCNTRSYLDSLKAQVLANIRTLQGAPSVQLQTVPIDHVDSDTESDDASSNEEDVSRPNIQVATLLQKTDPVEFQKIRISLRQNLVKASMNEYTTDIETEDESYLDVAMD